MMSNFAARLYYSREDLFAKVADPDDRVQCVDAQEDYDRALDPLTRTAEVLDELHTSLGEYFDEVDEGHPEAIKRSRERLVMDWAMAQGTLSKLAWVLRIDGNDAFQRLMNAIKDGKTANMEGL
jgi:hypothetical protein